MIYSEAVMRALAGGGVADPSIGRNLGRSITPAKVGVVITKTADPNADVIDAIELLNEEDLGSTRRRKRKAAGIGQSHAGYYTLEDRECCIALMFEVNRTIHHRRLPFEVQCPDCGASYRLEMGVTGYE